MMWSGQRLGTWSGIFLPGMEGCASGARKFVWRWRSDSATGGDFAAKPGDKFLQALTHAGAGLVAQEVVGLGDVGVGQRDVAGLVRVFFDNCFFAADIFEG